MRRPSTTWYAVALLVASTVGIGFYGIPYTFAKAGTGIGVFFLLGVTALVLISNLLYGEVVLRTHERHQFVGYVNAYLGPWARLVNLFTFWVSLWGAIVGIMLLSGKFISEVMSYAGAQINPKIIGVLVLAIVTTFVFRGLKMIAHMDFVVMILASLIVGMIIVFGTPHMVSGNFAFASKTAWFLPFGVILFSLNGVQGVPLVREVLIGKEHWYRRALVIGTLIPALLYLVFTMVVVGVTGPMTSPEAIPGLAGILGGGVIILGSLFGALTSGTILLSILTSFRESLKEDFHLRRRWHMMALLLPPLLLFLFGGLNFVRVISLVGGIAVSIDMILLIMIYAQAKQKGTRIPEYTLSLPKIILYSMMVLFALGALYTVVS